MVATTTFCCASADVCVSVVSSPASMRGINIRARLEAAVSSERSSCVVLSAVGVASGFSGGGDCVGVGVISRARLPEGSFWGGSELVWRAGWTWGVPMSARSVPTDTSQSSGVVCVALSILSERFVGLFCSVLYPAYERASRLPSRETGLAKDSCTGPY